MEWFSLCLSLAFYRRGSAFLWDVAAASAPWCAVTAPVPHLSSQTPPSDPEIPETFPGVGGKQRSPSNLSIVTFGVAFRSNPQTPGLMCAGCCEPYARGCSRSSGKQSALEVPRCLLTSGGLLSSSCESFLWHCILRTQRLQANTFSFILLNLNN